MKYVKLFEDYSTNANSLNSICYGNPTQEKYDVAYNQPSPIKDWFESEGISDKIIKEAPLNDSDVTKTDLQNLLTEMKNTSGEDLSFARYVEKVDHMAQSYIDLLAQKEIEVSMGDFFYIDNQLEPLIFWLKDKINRPRPYQLAKEYNMPLYPLMHTDAMSAAYPSGHAATAFLMSTYFSQKYPEHKEELMNLGERIAKSREITGIHYHSDTEISRKIVEIVFENKLLIVR